LTTGLAVLTLGLGIGATAALFSVVNAWLLRPLPFADPDRLVVVWETIPSAGITQNTPAPASLAAWEDQATAFAALAPWTLMTANLTGTGEPARLQAIAASDALLPLLGVSPLLGRNFTAGESRQGSDHVAIVSHAFWQSQLGGRSDALGTRLMLDGRPIEVIGVLPEYLPMLGFAFDLWRPLVLDRTSESRMLWVFGRLRPGVTPDQATREVAAIGEARAGNGMPARVVGLHEQTIGPIGRDVLVLFAATGVVLLIACANVASLTLARLSARRPELMLRAALGSSRVRIAGQVLVESLMLGAAGAAAGLLFCTWMVQSVVVLAPLADRMAVVTIADPRVLAFIIGAAMLTVMLFGVVPAWQAASSDLATEVRAGGRGLVAGRRRVLGGIVIAQMALALVLLSSAGLVLRSFFNLSGTDLGFRPDSLVVFDLPRARHVGAAQQDITFFSSLAERLSTTAGVQGVAVSQALPLRSVGSMGGGFVVEGRQAPDASISAFWRVVNEGYFAALRIPLRSGRPFTRGDVAGALDVAIVSESFARRAWPDADPLGRRIGWGNFETPLTVVGVAADIRQAPNAEPSPHVYMPFTQVAAAAPSQLAVRTGAGAAATVELVRRVVRDIDPSQPIAGVATGEQLVARTMRRRLFQLTLIAAFAIASTLLALVGVYGVLSFTTTQMLREMGIRLALGATSWQVRWTVVRYGLGLTLLGIMAGALLSTWSARLLEGFVSGTDRGDVATFAATAAALTAAALAACLVPARRASRVDPMAALRAE
jgi:putative ABC transport system permease protein